MELNRTTNECVTGHFHPPYAETVAEWEGTTQIADEGGRDGGGNREAYYNAHGERGRHGASLAAARARPRPARCCG